MSLSSGKEQPESISYTSSYSSNHNGVTSKAPLNTVCPVQSVVLSNKVQYSAKAKKIFLLRKKGALSLFVLKFVFGKSPLIFIAVL